MKADASGTAGIDTGLRVARWPWQRLRGLMFTRRGKGELLIPGCNDIHTYGMRYPIDVAFVDAQGQVTAAHRGLPARCRIRSPAACAVLERPAERMSRWYQPGAYVDCEVIRALGERKRP